MKRFIIRLLVFCCAPLAVLLPLAHVVDAGLRKSQHFFFSEWNDIFAGNINADVLIMGSSRAWVHFSPAIIDSALGVNSYNLGMDGTSLDLQFERLKIYLQHNKKPRYIIQEAGLNTVLQKATDLPHYVQFLPYLNDPVVWKVYQEKYRNVSLADRYFPLYKYNNQPTLIKEGIRSYMGKGVPRQKYKGYQGQQLAWDSSFSNFMRTHPYGYKLPTDTAAMTLLQEYVQFCKENDIKLIMVYAPYYYRAADFIKNLPEIMATLNDVARRNNVPFLDYTHNYLDSSTAYFYNSQHLNKQGAELFSHMLVQDVKPYMANKK